MPEGENTQAVDGGLDFTMGANPFEAQGATDGIGSDPSETTEEQAEAKAEASDDEQTVVLKDGTKVSLKEAINGYERHADYTRKTMALAEEAKENERAKTFYENFVAATQDPEGLRTMIGHLQRQVQALGADAPEDGFEYSEGEALLKQKIDSQAAEMRAVRDELRALRESALPEIESIKAEKRFSAAVSELKEKHGVETTQAQLRAYCESSGIDDPVKAYKVATYDESVKAGYVAGHQTASKKPAIPKGSARGVDYEDENLTSADEIFRRMVAEANAKQSP